MSTRTYATTNERLSEVITMVDELTDWAEADAKHALESDAPDTAKDDRTRARLLKKARSILGECF